MKNLIKIITIFILAISIFWIIWADAWVINLEWTDWIEKITNQSINTITSTWDISSDLKDNWYKLLTIVKTVISWLLVIFIVYIWIQMIMSMWSDEDKLTTSKTQLRYTLMALIFINIPWSLYNMFVTNRWQLDWKINWTWSSTQAVWNESVFINIDWFTQTINWWIVLFIESAIFTIAVFMIILSAIKIMLSAWKEEDVTESKNKIIRSLIWLVFVWFIESWQLLIFEWKVKDWATIFATIENLALFFAGPIAIFFLTLAWYYYITSNGDEERTKKAKNIIVNVVIATVILLASHLFLQDLSKLTI
jgi:hypothetical protein